MSRFLIFFIFFPLYQNTKYKWQQNSFIWTNNRILKMTAITMIFFGLQQKMQFRFFLSKKTPLLIQIEVFMNRRKVFVAANISRSQQKSEEKWWEISLYLHLFCFHDDVYTTFRSLVFPFCP